MKKTAAGDQKKATPDALEGMSWWNAMSDSERAHWLKVAGSATPADAWASYKNLNAFVRLAEKSL